MPDLIEEIGLLKRQFRDVHSLCSNIDHRTRNLASPAATPRSDALLSKALVCHALSGLRSKPGEPVSAAAVAAQEYRNDYAVLGALAKPGSIVNKAASAPAMTTVTGWAAELSGPGVSDRGFLQLLAPTSVYSQLSSRPNSIRVDLSGYGSVRVPTRALTPTIGGSFVGQGAPFPVRQALMSSVALTPKKLAVGAMVTGEMLSYSLPNVETVVRAIMAFDTAIALDSVLLDSNPATAIRPAGILNGVSATTATAGGGLNAFISDLRALATAIEASGALYDPVLILSSSQALILPVLMQGGVTNMPIIASPNVAAKTIIMLDAANFASGEADEPKLSSSKEALVHAEDTSPLQIGTSGSPNTVAAPAISMFQSDCVTLALKQDAEWIMTRAGRIAVVNSVTW